MLAVHPLESEGSPFAHRAGTEPIPGYRLIAPLGRGGFGEVWKCEAPGGLHKAIKFVHGGLHALDENAPADEELRAIQRVKSIRHPFLLSMERVEMVGGDLVIVLELADRNLADVLRAEQAAGRAGIPRDTLLGYLGEVAEVLDVMHAQHHLQHLDVKPQNLFQVSTHVKVGDFGLVNSFSSRESGRPQAAPQSAITPLYASPEVFEGNLSRHSDQYSLAIVYQELLTGTLPFAGKNSRQVMMQHLHGEPNLVPLPEADRPVVARALAKGPGQRFPSCSDFLHALAAGQSELVAEARRTPGPRTARARTNRALPPTSPQPTGDALQAPGPPIVPSPSATRPGEVLHFRFGTSLPADVIRLRLDGFRRQWSARVVSTDAEGLVLHMQAPRSSWQRWAGRQPQLEVRLRALPAGDLSTSGGTEGAEVRMELSLRDCSKAQSAELLRVVGPLFAESFRAHLQVNHHFRAQERLPWRHALQVCPILPDGSLGPPVECQGKDISLNGIGFYAPGQAPSGRMMLHLPQSDLTPRMSFPARAVRVQGCGDGWHEVGAVLDLPQEGPLVGSAEREDQKASSAALAVAQPGVMPAPMHSWRTRWTGLVALAAILAGLGVGTCSRLALPAPGRPALAPNVAEAPAPQPPAKTAGPAGAPAPSVSSRIGPERAWVALPGREKEYEDLQSAIADAREGDVLVVVGTLRSRPARVVGKALTIRGAPGGRAALQRLPSEDGRWEPLLWSDRPLVVERLQLLGGDEDVAPLVCVEGASLALRGCKLVMPAPGPAVVLRRGQELHLEGCELDVGGQGLSVELAGQPCRVVVQNSRVAVRARRGPLLVAWAGETGASAALDVELTGSRVEAGRVLACQGVAGPVRVAAKGNRLVVRQVRVSFAGYSDPAMAARQVVSWRDVEDAPAD